MQWIKGTSSDELKKNGRSVIRQGARQIALLQHEGRVYAVDNRCPHEGYPLSEGSIQPGTCLLTCNWHNWKFDLNTGETLLGEDHVNVYETRVQDGVVWIAIPELSTQALSEKILRNLRAAFDEQQYGRIARELARLHYNGIDPEIAVRSALGWTHDRLEMGFDHSFAVASDWLSLYHERQETEERIVCLTEIIDYMSESALRMPEYPFTNHRFPFDKTQFLSAVEQEDEEKAVGQVFYALESGRHFEDLEETLTAAALMHYNDFGHSLIYLFKARQLVERLGPAVERHVLASLVRSICLATREDTLPEFKRLRESVEAWPMGKNQVSEISTKELLGMGTNDALQWILRQAETYSPESIYFALLHANAWSLLHYNLDLQFSFTNPVSKNIGWLDFTHGITFANAVRRQCSRFPQYWKYGLLQMACFLGRNHTFLDLNVREEDWFVSDEGTFHRKSIEQLLDHGNIAPIFVAHYVKTYFAAREEAALAPPATSHYILASVRRFMESPLRQKHVRRTVRQALSLVGKDFD